MKNFAVREIFEQNSSALLPAKAARITQRVARRHRAYSDSDQHTKNKQREIAQAVLYMSLYEQFGPKCDNFIDKANELLDRLLDPDPFNTILQRHQFSWR